MTMEFGIFLPIFLPEHAGRAVSRFAQMAEELGFDSLWTGDHVAVPRDSASSYPYGKELLATGVIPDAETASTMMPIRPPGCSRCAAVCCSLYRAGEAWNDRSHLGNAQSGDHCTGVRNIGRTFGRQSHSGHRRRLRATRTPQPTQPSPSSWIPTATRSKSHSVPIWWPLRKIGRHNPVEPEIGPVQRCSSGGRTKGR